MKFRVEAGTLHGVFSKFGIEVQGREKHFFNTFGACWIGWVSACLPLSYSRFFPTTPEGLPAVNASHDLGDTWRMFEELYEEKKVVVEMVVDALKNLPFSDAVLDIDMEIYIYDRADLIASHNSRSVGMGRIGCR